MKKNQRFYNLFAVVVLITIMISISCSMRAENRKTEAAGYAEKGLAAYQNAAYDSALVLYNRAILLDSTEAELYSGRGLVKKYLTDTLGAIADYIKASEIDSSCESPMTNLTSLYLEMGRTKEAETVCRTIININKNCLLAHFGLGLALFRQGERENAMEAFFTCINRYDLANELRLQNKINHYSFSSYMNCRASSHYYIGLCFKELKETEKAIEHLEIAKKWGVREAEDSLMLINKERTKTKR